MPSLFCTLFYYHTSRSSVADPACNLDPDSFCHFDADPAPNFQIKAQNLEKVPKKANIPYI
jgi:hypothetical protein